MSIRLSPIPPPLQQNVMPDLLEFTGAPEPICRMILNYIPPTAAETLAKLMEFTTHDAIDIARELKRLGETLIECHSPPVFYVTRQIGGRLYLEYIRIIPDQELLWQKVAQYTMCIDASGEPITAGIEREDHILGEDFAKFIIDDGEPIQQFGAIRDCTNSTPPLPDIAEKQWQRISKFVRKFHEIIPSIIPAIIQFASGQVVETLDGPQRFCTRKRKRANSKSTSPNE